MTAEQQASAARLGPKLDSLNIARLGALRSQGLSLADAVVELDLRLNGPMFETSKERYHFYVGEKP